MRGDAGSTPATDTKCLYIFETYAVCKFLHLSINVSMVFPAQIVSILLYIKSSVHNCIINSLYHVTNLDILKFNGVVSRKRTRDLGDSLSFDVLKQQKKSLTIQNEHSKLHIKQKLVLARALYFLPSLDVL